MDYRDYYRLMAAEITELDAQNALRALAGHVGKSNPIVRHELALAVYGKDTSSTDRKVRNIIPMLLVRYGIAVASTSGKAGYYICETNEERMEAYSYLRSVISELNTRANALWAANIPEMAEAIPMQGGLF